MGEGELRAGERMGYDSCMDGMIYYLLRGVGLGNEAIADGVAGGISWSNVCVYLRAYSVMQRLSKSARKIWYDSPNQLKFFKVMVQSIYTPPSPDHPHLISLLLTTVPNASPSSNSAACIVSDGFVPSPGSITSK